MEKEIVATSLTDRPSRISYYLLNVHQPSLLNFLWQIGILFWVTYLTWIFSSEDSAR